jgi:hypothetical protein
MPAKLTHSKSLVGSLVAWWVSGLRAFAAGSDADPDVAGGKRRRLAQESSRERRYRMRSVEIFSGIAVVARRGGGVYM